jgi:hypothetical protein
VLLYHDGRPDAAAEAGERAPAVFRELDDPAGASQRGSGWRRSPRRPAT